MRSALPALLLLSPLVRRGAAVPFPDVPLVPLPDGCQITKVGCYSDGCLDAPEKCPKTIDRALGGDTAVHRFDKACPGGTTDQNCPKVGLTTMECFELCAMNSFSYAGLEAGRCCYCADEISSGPQTKKAADSECNTKCFGNQSETCGGAFRVDIYTVDCGAGWGLWFLIVLGVVSAAYFGGGTVYRNHSKGLQGAAAVPHVELWRNMHGLVLDGVTFSKAQLLYRGYKPIDNGETAEEQAARVKATSKLEKVQAVWAKERRQARRGERTALMEAAMVGSADKLKKSLKRLVEKGAKAEAELGALDDGDMRCYTAYHHACAGGHTKCVAQLVAAGCDTACVTDAGKTGWELAEETRKTEVAEWLQKASEKGEKAEGKGGKKRSKSSKSGKGEAGLRCVTAQTHPACSCCALLDGLSLGGVGVQAAGDGGQGAESKSESVGRGEDAAGEPRERRPAGRVLGRLRGSHDTRTAGCALSIAQSINVGVFISLWHTSSAG